MGYSALGTVTVERYNVPESSFATLPSTGGGGDGEVLAMSAVASAVNGSKPILEWERAAVIASSVSGP